MRINNRNEVIKLSNKKAPPGKYNPDSAFLSLINRVFSVPLR